MNGKKIRKSPANLATLAAASLVAGSIVGLSTQTSSANEQILFRSLGSGAEVRTNLLGGGVATGGERNSSYGGSETKGGEGKCGEGRCGEGGAKGAAATPTPVSKAGEGKCGEGKCG